MHTEFLRHHKLKTLLSFETASSDQRLLELSVAQIETKLRTGWARNWPAPIGQFLVNVSEIGHVEAELLNEHPLRRTDDSCRVAFYQGVKSMEANDMESASRFVHMAVDIPDRKIWSTEFVLARHESQTPSG